MKIDEIRKIYRQNQSFQNDLPNEVKGFNWAAFLLTFIWGIPHKVWITLVAIPLIWFQLPFGINWLLLLVFQLYCGIRGNEWAFRANNYKSGYEFRISQIKWTIFAILLNIAVPFIILLFVFVCVKKVDFNEFIQNAQCSVVYKRLKSKTVRQISLKSENQLAEDFARNFAEAKSDNNSVIFSLSEKDKSLELYYINFYKNSQKCSLVEQNCKIQSGFSVPTEIYEPTGECLFYFDDDFNIEPSEATKKSIQKGYNIFNYL